MALYKINDFDPDHRNTPDSDTIQGFDVYTDRNEKVGNVTDALLDQAGNFRYLVVDLSSWMSGKQVLVPVGRSQIDAQARRIYVSGLSKAQAANLPDYHVSTPVDHQHEQQVRTVYRTRLVEDSAPLESSASLEGPRVVRRAPMNPPPQAAPPSIPQTPSPIPASAPSQPTEAYTYQQDPDLYEVNEQNHQALMQHQERLRANRRFNVEHSNQEVMAVPSSQPTPAKAIQEERVVQEENIPLMEERLIVDRQKRKTGEFVVRKEIETEYIQVPVYREKLIVEEVGAEPRRIAEIDLHDDNSMAVEPDSPYPDHPHVNHSEHRSPENPL